MLLRPFQVVLFNLVLSMSDTNTRYDFILVGGGSSGCVLAARLAASGKYTVALIEAGQPASENPHALTADGFKYAFGDDRLMQDRLTQPQAACGQRRAYAGTGKGLGGSGSVNGMVYTRGDVADYAQWPVGWQWPDVEPAFNELEASLTVQSRQGTAFTEAVIAASEMAGFKRAVGMNDGMLTNKMGYNDMNYRGNARRSSYTAFLHEATYSNLTIITDAMVERVLFENAHAVAVQYRHEKILNTIYATHEIVLCAGALETPKLLMLSGIGPAEHLAAHGIPVVSASEGVGQHLHDHPNVSVFYQANKSIDFNYPQLYGFARVNSESVLADGQPDTCFAWVPVSPKTMQQALYRMLPVALLPKTLFHWRPIRWMLRRLVDAVFYIPWVQRWMQKIFAIAVILGKPHSRGSVRLASADPSKAALIDPGYYKDSDDMNTLLNGIDKAQAIIKQPALQAWGVTNVTKAVTANNPDTIKKWVMSATMTTFHFCGSCKMGDTDDAPVDRTLCVKGVRRLRVADASVMPFVPVSATNAPSMMIGYRAADWLLPAAEKRLAH